MELFFTVAKSHLGDWNNEMRIAFVYLAVALLAALLLTELYSALGEALDIEFHCKG